MEKLTEYGPIGIVALIAFSAAGILWRDNKRLEKEKDVLEKEKFDLAIDTRQNVILSLKSVDDTMKAILIAIDTHNDSDRQKDSTKDSKYALKN